jgi:hypothetical protein
MGSASLRVPASYSETLRAALMAEVRIWQKAVKREMALIRENERYRPELLAAREGDLVSSQQMLTQSAAFIPQVPLHGANEDAMLEGDREALRALVDQSVRFCAKDICEATNVDPIKVQDVRAKFSQLDWWLSEIEARA